MMKEKSQVMDIDRSIYDIKDVENNAYRIKNGLTPEIIEKISKEKKNKPTTLYGCSSSDFKLCRYITRYLPLIGVRHWRGLIWTILPHM
jgi:hypothetical protein